MAARSAPASSAPPELALSAGPVATAGPAVPDAAGSAPDSPIIPPRSAPGWLPGAAGRSGRPLSGDAWLLARAPVGFPVRGGPTYGGSQVGAVLRSRVGAVGTGLALVQLRGSTALGARSDDVAIGLVLRPRRGPGIQALAELRVVETGTTTLLRPAAGLVIQTGPHGLPGDFSVSGYAQAGWVGGPGPVVHGDSQALVDRRVAGWGGAELRLGLSAWAAGQTGATRLDLGPTLSLSVPVGASVRARLQTDWRQRLAGNAAPGSGPALVLATSF